MAAARARDWYDEEAKRRQRGGQGGKLLQENSSEANGQARDQAGKDFRVSGKENSPDPICDTGQARDQAGKDFTPLELAELAEDLWEFEKEEAKKRQGMRTDLEEHSGNLPEVETGRTRDKVAAALGTKPITSSGATSKPVSGRCWRHGWRIWRTTDRQRKRKVRKFAHLMNRASANPKRPSWST